MDSLTPVLVANRHIPIYQQLYNYIKEEITAGRISYNSKLPSKRKLSAHLGISRNTVQAAYDQLIEEGYIHSCEKKGYYVNRLDHLQKLKLGPLSEDLVKVDHTIALPYDYSYHGVDIDAFPFEIWRRLTKEIINEYDKELLQLGDSFGYYRLRSVLAAYLHQSRGVKCTMDQVIISSGTEMLFQSLLQLFSKDYCYGIEDPGYERLPQLLRGNRATFIPIPIDGNGMIAEEVEKTSPNVLCITPAHQFPSGQIMPINRRIRLLNWANKAPDRYIIEDDYDSEFKYSGKPIPALQGIDTNEKVIYMGSLSKSISPTLRVSYMVLPPQLLKLYRRDLSYQLCPVPIFEQKILCRFIEDGFFERHLNRMRNIYKKKRELLVSYLQGMDRSVKILGADAGLHLLLQVANSMSEEQLILTAARVGVRVYRCSSYYLRDNRLPEIPTILFGYATIREYDIEASCELLKKAWYPLL